MILGIVGAKEAKFTEKGKKQALEVIEARIEAYHADGITSGHCHLGGIDIWAEEVASRLGILQASYIFPPVDHSWSKGYMPRNIQIARTCDVLLNIVVDVLPKEYDGMKFQNCYHCIQREPEYSRHVKSGGCWTMWYAHERCGKPYNLITVENY